jgi:hypothetical protein
LIWPSSKKHARFVVRPPSELAEKVILTRGHDDFPELHDAEHKLVFTFLARS